LQWEVLLVEYVLDVSSGSWGEIDLVDFVDSSLILPVDEDG
jgi:hypothetical protein